MCELLHTNKIKFIFEDLFSLQKLILHSIHKCSSQTHTENRKKLDLKYFSFAGIVPSLFMENSVMSHHLTLITELQPCCLFDCRLMSHLLKSNGVI